MNICFLNHIVPISFHDLFVSATNMDVVILVHNVNILDAQRLSSVWLCGDAVIMLTYPWTPWCSPN